MSGKKKALVNPIVTAIVELKKWQEEDPAGFAAVAELDPEELEHLRRDPQGFAALQRDVAEMMATPVTPEDIREYEESVARHLAAEEQERCQAM